MEKIEKGVLNRIRWIYKLTKHDLFWHGVRNNLAKLGIDIMPYFYFVATKENAKPQSIKGEKLDLKFSTFDENDIKFIKSSIIGIEQKDFLADLKAGDVCIGLKNNNEIVAYTFIKSSSFYFRKRYFDMFKNQGVKYHHTIVEYFNKGALKVQYKANLKR